MAKSSPGGQVELDIHVLGVKGLQRHRYLVQVLLVDFSVQRPSQPGTVQYQHGSAARLLDLYAERLHLLYHGGAARDGDDITMLDAGRFDQPWGKRLEPPRGLRGSRPRGLGGRVAGCGIALRGEVTRQQGKGERESDEGS